MMCRDLTSELAHFDLRKEQELKQVFQGFAAALLEKHEKVFVCLCLSVCLSVHRFVCTFVSLLCSPSSRGNGMQ